MPYSWRDYLGQLIDGQYVLSEFIGEAGDAAVFGTTSDRLDARTIIHVLHAAAPSADRHYYSWSIAANLSHPGLVRVHAAGRTRLDGIPVVYAVTDRPDDNLGDAIRERVLTPEEARSMLEAILPAIAYLHQHELVHANIVPESIVAVGTQAKLNIDSVVEARDGDAYSSDVSALGATLVEVLTQQRTPEAAARLPTPFREIAIGCLQADPKRRWSLERAGRALDGSASDPERATQTSLEPPPPPPPVAESARRIKPVLVTVAVILVVLVGALVYRYSSGQLVTVNPAPTAVEPAQTRQADRTNVVSKPVPAAPAPQPAKIKPVQPLTGSGWAVVAAIYSNFEAAERQARSVRERWSQFPATVRPPKGQGRRYLVVLGSGLTKEQAEDLRRRATSAGLPRDTYVTRLSD